MGSHIYERIEERYCICGAVIVQRNVRSRETGRLVRRDMVKPSLLRRFEAKHGGDGHRLIDAKTYHEKYPLCPFHVSLVDLALPFRTPTQGGRPTLLGAWPGDGTAEEVIGALRRRATIEREE